LDEIPLEFKELVAATKKLNEYYHKFMAIKPNRRIQFLGNSCQHQLQSEI
jgi:hypothetical protein